jgi:SpoVK/Ycf46/Vps4 family AAA+-type ATPase
MADLTVVIKDMAMMPIREITQEKILEIKGMEDIREIQIDDFHAALRNVAPSVSKQTIAQFDKWRKEKG